MGYNTIKSKPNQETAHQAKQNPENKTKKQNDYETIRNQILDTRDVQTYPLAQKPPIKKYK